jgi:hypothetical protein
MGWIAGPSLFLIAIQRNLKVVIPEDVIGNPDFKA